MKVEDALAGLVIGMAIVAVGAGFYQVSNLAAEEIPPSTYRFLGRTADPQERRLIMRFMEDGRITYSELGKLNDFNERRAVPIAEVKKELAQ